MSKGTYVAAKFGPVSTKLIKSYLDEGKIPNPVAPEDLHVTIVYSRKFLPNAKAIGTLNPPKRVIPEGFEIFEDDGKKILVLRVKSAWLDARHSYFKRIHGATYDYDQYRPHITLSGDFRNMDVSDLRPISVPLLLSEEYMEELDVDKEAG